MAYRGGSFTGSFAANIDDSGCFVFPEEWRRYISKDRTFYFAPSNSEKSFTLSPKEVFDLELALSEELAKTNKLAIGLAEEYTRGAFKEVADEGWRLHVPAAVMESLGAKSSLTLVGGFKDIMVFAG